MMEVNQKSAKLFNFRYVFLLPCVVPETICYHFMGLIPGGGTWVFFGWVCAARDSKLAPRSKKKFP